MDNDFSTPTYIAGTGYDATIPEKALDRVAPPDNNQLDRYGEVTASGSGADGNHDGMHNEYPFGSNHWMLAAEKERARREATFVEDLAAIDTLLDEMRDKWEQEIQAENVLKAELHAIFGISDASGSLGDGSAQTLDLGLRFSGPQYDPYRGFITDTASVMERARRERLGDELMHDETTIDELCCGLYDRILEEAEKEQDEDDDYDDGADDEGEARSAMTEPEAPLGLSVDCNPREEDISESLQPRAVVKAVIDADKEARKNQQARLWSKVEDAEAFFALMHARVSDENVDVDEDEDEDEDSDEDDNDELDDDDVDDSDEDDTATETSADGEHGYGYGDLGILIVGKRSLQHPFDDEHVDVLINMCLSMRTPDERVSALRMLEIVVAWLEVQHMFRLKRQLAEKLESSVSGRDRQPAPLTDDEIGILMWIMASWLIKCQVELYAQKCNAAQEDKKKAGEAEEEVKAEKVVVSEAKDEEAVEVKEAVNVMNGGIRFSKPSTSVGK